jgi:hypothetical protein
LRLNDYRVDTHLKAYASGYPFEGLCQEIIRICMIDGRHVWLDNGFGFLYGLVVYVMDLLIFENPKFWQS